MVGVVRSNLAKKYLFDVFGLESICVSVVSVPP
jgi:hypothetical protein